MRRAKSMHWPRAPLSRSARTPCNAICRCWQRFIRCRFLGLISLLISARDDEGIAEMAGAFTLPTRKGKAADGRLVVAPA